MVERPLVLLLQLRDLSRERAYGLRAFAFPSLGRCANRIGTEPGKSRSASGLRSGSGQGMRPPAFSPKNTSMVQPRWISQRERIIFRPCGIGREQSRQTLASTRMGSAQLGQAPRTEPGGGARISGSLIVADSGPQRHSVSIRHSWSPPGARAVRARVRLRALSRPPTRPRIGRLANRVCGSFGRY